MIRLLLITVISFVHFSMISGNAPPDRHPCELLYSDTGDVLLLLDGHLYEIAAWHSSECSCGIVFEVDDPED